jgi:hypothetical protein
LARSLRDFLLLSCGCGVSLWNLMWEAFDALS